jgi:hypothetical protein
VGHIRNENGVYGRLQKRLDHAVLRAVTRIVVGLPPVKKALLSQQVQSRFFRAITGG